MDDGEVLYSPPKKHLHHVTVPDRVIIGTVGRCACGMIVTFRASPSGRIEWVPATRRELRKLRREGVDFHG